MMITRLRNGTRKKFVVTTFPLPAYFFYYTPFFFFCIPRPLQRPGASMLVRRRPRRLVLPLPPRTNFVKKDTLKKLPPRDKRNFV